MLFINPFQNLLSWLSIDAADFDGTNDYMLRGSEFTGIADGKTGTVAGWFRIDGADGETFAILSNDVAGGRFAFYRGVANRISINGRNSLGAIVLNISTASTVSAGDGWIHLMASWDLATSAAHLYVNGISDITITSVVNDAIDYTRGEWAVGAMTNAGTKFNGCMADLYFSTEYIDLSVEDNRKKFLANRRPVQMGSDGSLPTGTAPVLCLHLDDGEAVANFATNRGTGGNFTITGALNTASTSPSD